MQCPLCDREMIEGPTVDLHHLIPKSKGGKETVLLHLVCHRKIHSVFTEKELARSYNTIESLKKHQEIQKFIEWVSKKDPAFIVRHTEHKNKKKRK